MILRRNFFSIVTVYLIHILNQEFEALLKVLRKSKQFKVWPKIGYRSLLSSAQNRLIKESESPSEMCLKAKHIPRPQLSKGTSPTPPSTYGQTNNMNL